MATGKPGALDPFEPTNVASAVKKLGLEHVVITSVDRDDLDDGGAGHFAQTIGAIREASPETTIEVLTPDFLRKEGAIATVVEAKPDVFNHNLETVPRLYTEVRPGARYFTSLRLLDEVKQRDPSMFTKSGLMVGLGESKDEVLQVMDDLRAADVDFLTIGQYLQPTPKHHVIDRFVTPEEFEQYKTMAYGKGFLMVSASPLTRSSYHAGDDFQRPPANPDVGDSARQRRMRSAYPLADHFIGLKPVALRSIALTFGARCPKRMTSKIILQKPQLRRFVLCAKTAFRPPLPHSSAPCSKDSAKDMSDGSESTPSASNNPTKLG